MGAMDRCREILMTMTQGYSLPPPIYSPATPRRWVSFPRHCHFSFALLPLPLLERQRHADHDDDVSGATTAPRFIARATSVADASTSHNTAMPSPPICRHHHAATSRAGFRSVTPHTTRRVIAMLYSAAGQQVRRWRRRRAAHHYFSLAAAVLCDMSDDF